MLFCEKGARNNMFLLFECDVILLMFFRHTLERLRIKLHQCLFIKCSYHLLRQPFSLVLRRDMMRL